MKDLSDSRILIVDDVKANVDILVAALRDDYKLSRRARRRWRPSQRREEPARPRAARHHDARPRRLRGLPPAARTTRRPRELPVMFLSALEDVQNKTRGFEAGGNDYLTKPFEVLEVKARVRSLLKAKAYADAVQEALARDLRIAREIQMGILPADLAAATKGTGLEVHAIIEPAREVGGDLYEVLRVSDDRVVVALGDVSGKGIPASLFMAVAITVLRTLARQIHRARRDPAPPERRTRRAEPARHVRHPAVSGVRPGAAAACRSPAPGITSSRSSRPAGRHGSACPSSGTAGRAHASAIHSSARPCRSSLATPSCCSRTACPRP